MMRKEAEHVVGTFGKTTEELNQKFAALLERQSSSMQSLIDSASDILKQGNALASNMNLSIGTVGEAIGNIKIVSQQLTDSASVLKSSCDKLQVSTAQFTQQHEQYLVDNHDMLDRMLQSQSELQQLLYEFAEKSEVIENSLSKIFVQVEQGLNSYAVTTRETISNYLSDFSMQLSEASKHLAGSVEALAESTEDIEDVLFSVKPR